jgi:hypothetical protein
MQSLTPSCIDQGSGVQAYLLHVSTSGLTWLHSGVSRLHIIHRLHSGNICFISFVLCVTFIYCSWVTTEYSSCSAVSHSQEVTCSLSCGILWHQPAKKVSRVICKNWVLHNNIIVEVTFHYFSTFIDWKKITNPTHIKGEEIKETWLWIPGRACPTFRLISHKYWSELELICMHPRSHLLFSCYK